MADPSDRFVYVANDSSTSVSAYSITAGTGALVMIGGSPYSAGTGAHSIAMDPSGRSLYLPDVGSRSVFMFAIDSSSGALTLKRTIQGRASTTSIALATGTAPVTYTPKFAYAANSDDNTVSGYNT